MTAPGADEGTAPRTGTHLHDLLGPWVPHQRWYPAKGRQARLQLTGALAVPAAGEERGDDVRVRIHTARIVDASGDDQGDGAGRPAEVVQVPLVHRRAPRDDAGAAAALLGTLTETGEDGASATWHVYDGPADPAFTDALLELLAGRVRAVGLGGDGRHDEAAGAAAGRRPGTAARSAGSPPPPVPAAGSPARVLRGEQSNTSIIVEPADGPAVIVKLFRTLHPGHNPDVEVQAALSAAGVPAVPALSAWLAGSWLTGGEQALADGDLAVASEFLAGAQDAWREAVAAVVAGEDFSAPAADLGAATAEVHRALAEQLPARPATEADADAFARGLRERARWALDSAPALAPHAAALAAVLDRGLPRELPGLQRIHGDYHLGQVLHAAERGWVLLDFEGEPLRPLAERTLPDLALRDVAGMLRSFDYAAQQAGGSPEHRTWAEAARAAFLDGYAGAAGSDPREHPALLDALELDKALYEVVYETRNRPDWVGVPLSAVGRLLERLAAG